MVNDSLSEDKREALDVIRSTTYTDVFNKRFPYHLAIGMTEEQYWDKDPMLAKYFRQAEDIRSKRRNQELWLQGMYIYDAIQRLSPILKAFPKKGTKAQPYPEEPYPLTKEDQEDIKKKREKEQMLKNKRVMESYMIKVNKHFAEKGSEKDVNNDSRKS